MPSEPAPVTSASRGEDRFDGETAGEHMVARIPRALTDTPVKDVIRSLRGQTFECADTVFVTDAQGRLEGIVRINDLFADGERRIDETMDPRHGALLRDEFIIGTGVGTALGLVSGVAVLVVFDDALLSIAVGLSVLGGGAVSAVVGFGLPWVFQRSGMDPALGSGPVCTIIQDVASLFIYFMLVTTLIL